MKTAAWWTISLLLAPLVLATSTRAEPSHEKPGAGFVEMFVAGVIPTPEGHTLVLVNPEEELLLPLGIGLTEALSIHGRLEKQNFTRPMTHDLLDRIVSDLGGKIVRVQIDDVRNDLFVGTIFIQKAGKMVSFDARPSDAVALAIGCEAPIFVASPVVDRAALHPKDLLEGLEDEPQASPQPDTLSL